MSVFVTREAGTLKAIFDFPMFNTALCDFTTLTVSYTHLDVYKRQTPYNALSVEVRAAISDLAALKFEVLRRVGDAVGNIQTYQL